MGVGLYMIGCVDPAPDDAAAWLQRAKTWFAKAHADMLRSGEVVVGRGHEDSPTLFVTLHPAAEPMEISLREDDGGLVASAKTSTVGPGYHIYLCDALKQLGEWGVITWDPPDPDEGTGDDTGYFSSGDRAAVETAMLAWLKAISSMVVENSKEVGKGERMMICMPMGIGYPRESGFVTPLGPRSLDWFRGAAQEPDEHIEFFPWWDEG